MLDQRMAFQLVAAQEALANVAARDSLARAVTTNVRRLIRHRGFVCCLASVGNLRVVAENWLAIEFPFSDLIALRQTERFTYSLVVDHLLQRNRPASFFGPDIARAVPPEYASIWARHGITNAVVSGSLYSSMRRLFYCVFTNVDPCMADNATSLVELIAPHIERAFRRTLSRPENSSAAGAKSKTGLTDQQLRVLYGIVCGRTNREIGLIEELSEDGVKYHIRKIFKKIDVENRAQAAAKGSRIFLVTKRPMVFM